MEVYRSNFANVMSASGFYRVWNNQAYKNVS